MRHSDSTPSLEAELQTRDKLRRERFTAVEKYLQQADALPIFAPDVEITSETQESMNLQRITDSLYKRFLRLHGWLQREAKDLQRSEGAQPSNHRMYTEEIRQLREFGFTVDSFNDTALTDLLQAAKGNVSLVTSLLCFLLFVFVFVLFCSLFRSLFCFVSIYSTLLFNPRSCFCIELHVIYSRKQQNKTKQNKTKQNKTKPNPKKKDTSLE